MDTQGLVSAFEGPLKDMPCVFFQPPSPNVDLSMDLLITKLACKLEPRHLSLLVVILILFFYVLLFKDFRYKCHCVTKTWIYIFLVTTKFTYT